MQKNGGKDMKKSFILVLLMTILLILQGCGSANTHVYILDSSYEEFITMGTSADYPPFEWQGKVDGKLTVVGIDVEIAKLIAINEGKNLKIVNKSFDFLLEDLENEKLDFVMAGLSATEEREKRVLFSIDYYNDGHALLINKKDSNKFNSIDALNKKEFKVGAQKGTVQQDIVTKLFTKAQTNYVDSLGFLVSNLRGNTLDGLLVEVPVAESYVKIMDYLAIADIEFENDGNNGFGVAVNKKSTELIKRINKVIKEIKESGKLSEIINEMIELNG